MAFNVSLLLPFTLCVIVGYLMGSINTAIIVTKVFDNNGDIRKQGSGNAGMTNVLRTVGKFPAIITFIGDFVKCVIACLIAWGIMAAFGAETMNVDLGKYLAGFACVVGHAFPVFFNFKGGKCIVTSASMMLMTEWRVFLLIVATFLIFFIWKRIISLGSVICAAMYPVYAFIISFFCVFKRGLCPLSFVIFVTGIALTLAALVLYRHRENIARLIRGEEKPIQPKASK